MKNRKGSKPVLLDSCPKEGEREVVPRTAGQDERFLAAVQVAIDEADRGEFIEHEEVVRRVAELLP